MNGRKFSPVVVFLLLDILHPIFYGEYFHKCTSNPFFMGENMTTKKEVKAPACSMNNWIIMGGKVKRWDFLDEISLTGCNWSNLKAPDTVSHLGCKNSISPSSAPALCSIKNWIIMGGKVTRWKLFWTKSA